MDNFVLDTKLFESFQDGVMILREGACCYANSEHRRLWIGTDSLTLPPAKYKPIKPHVDQWVIGRMVGQDTVTVNKGSSIFYYYLYCFPVNGTFYAVLTRDVTEQYLRHERDKEYKELFRVVFNAVRFPLAIVSTTGMVSRFTHSFFQCFQDKVALDSGNFIWEFFDKDRHAIKELFEELVAKRHNFEYRGFNFVAVSSMWVVVYCLDPESACPSAHHKEPAKDPPKEVTEEQVSDWLAFFRVLRSFKDMPWRALIITILGVFAVLGQLDPRTLIDLLNKAPTTEQTD
jgi:hypothetical protein